MGNTLNDNQNETSAPLTVPVDSEPPDALQKIVELRSQLQETFGKIVLALVGLPRYRSLGIGDLHHLVLEPLLRDRIAIAFGGSGDQTKGQDMAGFAIWASVSEEANSRILEQVNAGVFPIRLRPEDWNSGECNWLLDIVAPNKHVAASIIANFNKVTKGGGLRLHPLVSRQVDQEILKKLGAERFGEPVTSEQIAEQSNVKH